MPFITPKKNYLLLFHYVIILIKNMQGTFLKLLQFEISRQGHECQLENIEYANINTHNEWMNEVFYVCTRWCLWWKMYIYVIKLGTYLETLSSPCKETLYKNWKIPNEQFLLWINQGLAMLKQCHTQYSHFSFKPFYISNSYRGITKLNPHLTDPTFPSQPNPRILLEDTL